MEGFACDPGRIFRGQEHHGGRDILRLADATERSLGLDLLAEVAFLETKCFTASLAARINPRTLTSNCR